MDTLTRESPPVDAPPESAVKTINLALQGGGAHGAFAWGVLDRLLEDGRVAFDGISATSAGAMNATVLAYGLSQGGREGAREALDVFWRKISRSAALSPMQPAPWQRMVGDYSLDGSPFYLWFDMMTRTLAPAQFNPLNLNPLRQVLMEVVDFAALRRDAVVKLFLCATNVRTGKVRIFGNDEITADAVLASGCLPFLFHTVEIDGEPYWDGGYMGNPALFPLIYHCDSADVVVIHINPIGREEVPRTARDILNRINEISFNSSLMREMRAIAFVSRLIEDGTVADGALKRMLIHSIEAEETMRSLGVSTKLNPDWDFLCHLHRAGRRRADQWLARHFDQLGRQSTVDIRDRYL